MFTARLVCLALATPAALTVATSAPVATLSLFLLTISSLVFSRSDRLIATLIRHPLLASLDTAVTIALLTTVSAGQPTALTVVCTALVAGLLFPRRVLVLLVVPLVVGSLGAPAAVLSAAPTSWQGWLALVAGMPALVLGVCVIGSVVQRNVQSMVEARQQAAEAVAAVGAAQERARLARDMHDSVGKSIHGISLGSKALRRMVDRDPDQAKELAGSLADAADQAAREARALLMSLREGQIDRPTVEVVNEVLADWQATTGISARLVDVAAVDASAGRHRADGRRPAGDPAQHRQARARGDGDRTADRRPRADRAGGDRRRRRVRRGSGGGARGRRALRAARAAGTRRAGRRHGGDQFREAKGDHGSMDSTTTLDDLTTTTDVRVGIADDNAVVRMGIRSLLATADDIVVVGEAGDGASAVTLARTAKPDVMLLDVRMPRLDGVSAAADVAEHATVLMLTYSDSPEVVSAAVKAGARGYLVHGHFTENELLSAVRMAARGMGTFSAQAVAALSNPTPSKAALASRYGLSEREADVMALMAEGAANSEIARSLFISEKTVKNHINRIFTKLQANNRGHAVSLWLAHH